MFTGFLSRSRSNLSKFKTALSEIVSENTEQSLFPKGCLGGDTNLKYFLSVCAWDHLESGDSFLQGKTPAAPLFFRVRDCVFWGFNEDSL